MDKFLLHVVGYIQIPVELKCANSIGPNGFLLPKDQPMCMEFLGADEIDREDREPEENEFILF